MPQPYSYDLRQKVIQAIELDGLNKSDLVVYMLGRYHFSLPLAVMQGEMRSLRDPNDPLEQDD